MNTHVGQYTLQSISFKFQMRHISMKINGSVLIVYTSYNRVHLRKAEQEMNPTTVTHVINFILFKRNGTFIGYKNNLI